jgi:hypothetical protein
MYGHLESLVWFLNPSFFEKLQINDSLSQSLMNIFFVLLVECLNCLFVCWWLMNEWTIVCFWLFCVFSFLKFMKSFHEMNHSRIWMWLKLDLQFGELIFKYEFIFFVNTITFVSHTIIQSITHTHTFWNYYHQLLFTEIAGWHQQFQMIVLQNFEKWWNCVGRKIPLNVLYPLFLMIFFFKMLIYQTNK